MNKTSSGIALWASESVRVLVWALLLSLSIYSTSTKHDVQYTREHLAEVLKEIHWVARVTDKILLIRGSVKRKTWISASIKSNFDVLKYSTKIKKKQKQNLHLSTEKERGEDWEMKMGWTGVQVDWWKGSYSAIHTISWSFCLNILVYEVNAMLVVCMELACRVFH